MTEEANVEESAIEGEQAENALPDDDGQSDTGSEGEQDWEKDYKALQAEFTKVSQINAKNEGFLNAFGGEEGLRDTFDKLQNPEVPVVEDDFGLPDKATLEPEQLQAYEMVEKVAEKIAAKMIKAERESLDPRFADLEANSAQQRQTRIESVFGQMTEKHPQWEEMRSTMAEILPQTNINSNLTLAEMEQLYVAALQKSGKLEEFGAKLYEKKLAEKQKRSVDSPLAGSPGANGSIKIETIQDAARAAKVKLGIKEI